MKPKSIERLSPSNAMYIAMILAHKFTSIHTDAIPLQINGVPANKRSKPNKQHIGNTVVITDKIVKLTS